MFFGGLACGCASSGDGASSSGGASGACATPSDNAGALFCLLEALIIRVPNAASLAMGSSVLVNVDDHTAIVWSRDEGGLFARSAICTHACCVVSLCGDAPCNQLSATPRPCEPLASSSAMALCPCHGSKFRLSDGVPMNGPATTPLPA